MFQPHVPLQVVHVPRAVRAQPARLLRHVGVLNPLVADQLGLSLAGKPALAADEALVARVFYGVPVQVTLVFGAKITVRHSAPEQRRTGRHTVSSQWRL